MSGKPLFLRLRYMKLQNKSLILFPLRLYRWTLPGFLSSMPPQAEALSSHHAVRSFVDQPTAFPSPCQGVPDHHGHGTEGSEAASQLLQRHYLQQQAYRDLRAGQVKDSEIIPPDCLRPRSFTAIRRPSLHRETEDTRLSVSLCDLNLQDENFHVLATMCPIPQNSLNSQHSHLFPSQLESDLRFHQLRGAHIKILDDQTVARLEHAREERTLVFTSRPLRINETIFVKINKSNASRSGTLSYGVTSCDPSTLRPSDLPYNPESLVDRKEFWAVCRILVPLQSGDILGFMVNSEGELHLSHNGASAGMQVCVDCSQPLWMFFGLHGAVMQIRVLGSTILAERLGPSTPSSPTSAPNSPTGLCSGVSDPILSTCGSGLLCSSINGTAPNSPVSMPESPISPSGSGVWGDECTICYENMVDTVIYSCGHMCLCYPCGLKLKKMANACCPICRRAIKDIIKTYRST
ncbi:E3 ubiquitin-protein ligase NEURL1 isoform X4 [Dermochelys coriacea]|uniref:E3 ubiquitin-protein ligase NEURL1 isoform X4 n=1 Tax=Dermochelys coriacea TaxID=27794 RepID=UPI001CA885F1|nr:E3 ubiquitin-protein ligase NEURL1 isoform X4 [Dermochelys coriacea]